MNAPTPPLSRRRFTAGTAATVFTLPAAGLLASSPAWALSSQDAARGVLAALEKGVGAAVDLLGRADGFLGDAAVRIEPPKPLQKALKLLSRLGQGERGEQLVQALNRAAEAAVPEARDLLVQAVRGMKLQDAVQLVRGPDNAATAFFERQTRTPLAQRFLPIVTQATQQVALAERYNAVASRASHMGLVKAEDAQLESYVTQKALDGLFKKVADQERQIRQDPVGTGSDLLKLVFGRG
ncbi:MAG: DUF4197 domain-containing protein [Rubrivivax sp.]